MAMVMVMVDMSRPSTTGRPSTPGSNTAFALTFCIIVFGFSTTSWRSRNASSGWFRRGLFHLSPS